MDKVHMTKTYWGQRRRFGDAEGPEIAPIEVLMNEFEAHEASERKVLERYRTIAERFRSPFVKFLVELITADEERHHAIIRRVASMLKKSITWSGSDEALAGLYDVGEEKAELLEMTREFIREEKKGIKEIQGLAKISRDYYGGLLVLLLNSMVRDSEKHVEILEFLEKRLKRA
jgi:hypothetical protein